MKKKLLVSAYSMELGGIETSLVNLLKNIDYEKYDVTLVLEKKEGIFLEMLPKEVDVLEYRIYDDKNVFIRKIKNRLKLIKWQRKLKNKYDFAISFATYSIPGSYLAQAASINNAIWMHGNYYVLYDKDESQLKDFLDGVMIKKFKNIVFVSEENKRDVCQHYKGIEEKARVINNFIDGEEIIKKSEVDCDYKRGKEIVFVNVGRHDERQKKLSRIINSAEMLVKEDYKFKVLLIGDGEDTLKYKEMVKNKGLQEVVIFLGRKKNPFPYVKMSDAMLLSSEYEGYPVVFLEAMILGKPILSTKISDYEDLDGKYGVFNELSDEGVYLNMKKFLNDGFISQEIFDFKKYNSDILEKFNNLIEENKE